MLFYEGHTLTSTSDNNSFFTKEKLVLPQKILDKLFKRNISWREYLKNPIDLSIGIRNTKDDTGCTVSLQGIIDLPEYKHYTFNLAQCSLSTVEYNCSAIMIANLYCESPNRAGVGWWFLNLIEQWARYANYTLLIGNTAGSNQNNLIPKFKNLGWVESDINYVNSRTQNRNIWLYKVITDTTEQTEDEDEYYEDDDGLDTDGDH